MPYSGDVFKIRRYGPVIRIGKDCSEYIVDDYIYFRNSGLSKQERHYSLEADISYKNGEVVTIPDGHSTNALLSISFGLWSPCISCTPSFLDLPTTEVSDESSGFHSFVVPSC